MRTMMKVLATAILAVSITGCPADDENNEPNDHADVTEEHTDDVEQDSDVIDRDSDVNEEGSDAYTVTFELINESGGEIYAYETVAESNCGFRDKDWLTLAQDGESIRPLADCSLQTCGEEGAVCALECPEPSEAGAVLADGASRSLEWDGQIWKTDAEQSCEYPESVAGETFQASICYGYEFSDQGEIVDPTCEVIEFTLDQPEQTVRVSVPSAG